MHHLQSSTLPGGSELFGICQPYEYSCRDKLEKTKNTTYASDSHSIHQNLGQLTNLLIDDFRVERRNHHCNHKNTRINECAVNTYNVGIMGLQTAKADPLSWARQRTLLHAIGRKTVAWQFSFVRRVVLNKHQVGFDVKRSGWFHEVKALHRR